jgi:5'-nucleotidase/UDP-sugar diphosphatase
MRRQGTLTADCGDFLEGTGYYLLGGGRAEAELLTSLYDVAAPGNHGYAHHYQVPALHSITVCANVTGSAGTLVWSPLALAQIGRTTVAVTAVLGAEAFSSIPPSQRSSHSVTEPAAALRQLHRQWSDRVEAWIVLSHAGFGHDLDLARACPFISVIFSGHCHSPRTGPETVGEVAVVKGVEHAIGYATARPADPSWRCATRPFPAGPIPAPANLPASVRQALTQSAVLQEQLARPVGRLDPWFAARTPARPEILIALAPAALALTGADAVMLNYTCLREIPLGTQLHEYELLTWEPFGNTLITLRTTDAPALARLLTVRAGPIMCHPAPLPPPGYPVSVTVTDYLATTFLHDVDLHFSRASPDGAEIAVRELVRDVLLGLLPAPSVAKGAAR